MFSKFLLDYLQLLLMCVNFVRFSERLWWKYLSISRIINYWGNSKFNTFSLSDRETSILKTWRIRDGEMIFQNSTDFHGRGGYLVQKSRANGHLNIYLCSLPNLQPAELPEARMRWEPDFQPAAESSEESLLLDLHSFGHLVASLLSPLFGLVDGFMHRRVTLLLGVLGLLQLEHCLLHLAIGCSNDLQ